nr:helix-turn-helix domain-containing protein [uncultured Desulfobacter sp.]
MTDDELDILAAKIAVRIGVLPRWMTLKQASQYSNIGQKRLIDMVRHGELDGFQDLSLKTKPWRFDKNSIDNHMESQVAIARMEREEHIKFVKKIISSLKESD